MPEETISTGDLNFQFDDSTNIKVRRFSGPFYTHGLIQHVTGATYTRGQTMDVVITRHVSCTIQGMPSIFDPCLCDRKGNRPGYHLGIYITRDCTKPQHVYYSQDTQRSSVSLPRRTLDRARAPEGP